MSDIKIVTDVTALKTIFPRVNTQKLQEVLSLDPNTTGCFLFYAHLHIMRHDGRENHLDVIVQSTMDRVATDDVTELIQKYGEGDSNTGITFLFHLLYQDYTDNDRERGINHVISLGRMVLHTCATTRFMGAIIAIDAEDTTMVTEIIRSTLMVN